MRASPFIPGGGDNGEPTESTVTAAFSRAVESSDRNQPWARPYLALALNALGRELRVIPHVVWLEHVRTVVVDDCGRLKASKILQAGSSLHI